VQAAGAAGAAAAAAAAAPKHTDSTPEASPIPSIDVAPLFGDDARAKMRTARQMAEACEEIGFFSIHNHGVPRVISDSHFAVQLNHFIPDFLSYLVAFFLK
jgi:hypothetical protein